MNSIKRKLGIIVVYYLPPGMEWLLEVHLNEIERTTCETDFKIYAAIERLDETYIPVLSKNKNVIFPAIANTELTGSPEHCFYLDQLFKYALEDGCSHLLTLDADSWPIKPNWFSELATHMDKENLLVSAVLRRELGDEFLPHPCGTLIHRDFLQKFNFTMWGEEVSLTDKQNFNQRQDSGFGLAYLLWKESIPWEQLLRTNSVNLHYLMGAIYGDIFFHLGASGRLKIFNKELGLTWQRKFSTLLNKIPLIWKYKNRVEDILMNRFPPSIHYRNQKIYDKICKKLKANTNALYKELLMKSESHEKP